jgi:hypothetical protein
MNYDQDKVDEMVLALLYLTISEQDEWLCDTTARKVLREELESIEDREALWPICGVTFHHARLEPSSRPTVEVGDNPVYYPPSERRPPESSLFAQQLQQSETVAQDERRI